MSTCQICQKPIQKQSKFCSYKCKGVAMRGKGNPKWKGGVSNRRGIQLIYKPNHPFAEPNGYIPVHRLIAEEWLKNHKINSPYLIEYMGNFYLSSNCKVSHLDGNSYNNSITNLKISPK